jgi:hypothetical protein
MHDPLWLHTPIDYVSGTFPSASSSSSKIISHGQRGALVGFERDLLNEHYFTNRMIALGYKTPTNVTGFVEFTDIHSGRRGYPVSPTRVATDNLETALRFEVV